MKELLTFDIYLYIFIICSASLVVLVVFTFILKRINSKRQQRIENTEQEAYSKALSIIETAQKKALGVLNEAEEEAAEIISSTSKLTDESKVELRQKTSELIRHSMKSLDESLDDIASAYKQTVTTELKKDLQELKTTLEAQTMGVQTELKQEASVTYEQIKDDLEAYKKKQIENIDAKVLSTVSKVSSEIMGKVLPLNDHEALVSKMLEDAKALLKNELL